MVTKKELIKMIQKYKAKKCPSHSTSRPVPPSTRRRPRYLDKSRLQKILNVYKMIPVVFPPPSSKKKKAPKKKTPKKKTPKKKVKSPFMPSINSFTPIAERVKRRRR